MAGYNQYGQPPYPPQVQQQQSGYGPSVYVPQQGAPPGYSPPGTALPVPDAFVADLATGMLRQSGENYFQKGQAFVQSKMGFLSSSMLQYHFNISGENVLQKLLMLLVPFLRRWTYTRDLEQIAGGHKYLPPRMDVNAPDLYIPFMAACTYSVLACVALTTGGHFNPESMYSMASSAFAAWGAHWLVLKVLLYVLGIPSAVPYLEIVAYAGYPFVHASIGILVRLMGIWPYRAWWAYGSLATAVFMVRTMKRIIFHESRQYSVDSTRHNYLLFGLAVFQFPFAAWLAVTP